MPTNQNSQSSEESHDSGESEQLPVVTESARSAVAGLPAVGIPWTDPSAGVTEGFDFIAYMHSLRRRWLLGIAAGTVTAIVTAAMLAFLIPIEYEALALLRVNREDPGFGRGGNTNRAARDYETYKQTQAALIQSPYLVNAALRQPGITQLPMIQREENQVSWYQKQLRVTYAQGSEILMIGMKGEDGEQIKKLVDAIVDAYMDEVVYAERDRQIERLEILRRTFRKNTQEIKKMADVVRALQKDLATEDDPNVQVFQEFQRVRLRTGAVHVSRLESQVGDLELNLKMALAQQTAEFDPPQFAVEDELEGDRRYLTAKMNVDALQQLLQEATVSRGGSQAEIIRSQLISANASLERLRSDLLERAKYRVLRRYGKDPVQNTELISLLEAQLIMARESLEKLRGENQDAEQELIDSYNYSSDVEARNSELDSLTKVTAMIRSDMAELELDLARPARILKLQPAMLPSGSDRKIKLLMIGGLSTISFFGVIIGVAFLDYASKRVNMPSDVSKGTGVPVVGSVPILNRRLGGFWPFGRLRGTSLESVLVESIDTIRTALLCNTSDKQLDVVMVSSAGSQEGKTTLAAQLAISLARTGRRTLLVDADMHNPQQHQVFGIPFGKGFCELLRGEVNAEDVTQAVSAEGLWLMPAGYCNQASLRAIADETAGKIISDVKSEYDFIVLDSGPVLTGADPMLLGQNVDATILSVRRDISRLPKIVEAYDRLQSVGIYVMGAVVNGATMEVRSNRLELAYDPETPEASAT